MTSDGRWAKQRTTGLACDFHRHRRPGRRVGKAAAASCCGRARVLNSSTGENGSVERFSLGDYHRDRSHHFTRGHVRRACAERPPSAPRDVATVDMRVVYSISDDMVGIVRAERGIGWRLRAPPRAA